MQIFSNSRHDMPHPGWSCPATVLLLSLLIRMPIDAPISSGAQILRRRTYQEVVMFQSEKLSVSVTLPRRHGSLLNTSYLSLRRSALNSSRFKSWNERLNDTHSFFTWLCSK